MKVSANSPVELVEAVYAKIAANVEIGRARLGRGLTFAEKVLFGHLAHVDTQELERAKSYCELFPDRVAMQDATAQMALLQFMTAGLEQVAVPSTVHCDHLIEAYVGSEQDLATAVKTNEEVYDFLRSVSARYGVGFWKPGSGIIHQVVLEQYAFPGAMMIGTDSHTPNAGGLGMVAIGVGGADAVDVMVGYPFGVRWPKLIGVKLSGQMSGWTSAKDIILRVAQVLTVEGGTGAIVEYFGDGVATISATGRATVCNMGAEIGATTSIFPFDENTADYLVATGRSDVAQLARQNAQNLRADDDVALNPHKYFDKVIEIDLNTLSPSINGPHTPDLAHSVADIGATAKANGWPTALSSTLIGSCTNSSYEDITRTASIARQAAAAGLKVKTPLMITPGSERVRLTIERDGLLDDLRAIGATVLANACGPCIGQWRRDEVKEGDSNSILSSYNRNFPKRNDGLASTLSFVASPETVIAYALSGTFEFNPLTDELESPTGAKIKLDNPVGDRLPKEGFESGESGFISPPPPGTTVEVAVSPTSDRLQLLAPFSAWDGKDFDALPILAKAKGKCTTDHISAAGKWLKYRGHLENISGNLYIGVVNAFSSEAGMGTDVINGGDDLIPAIAKKWSSQNQSWVFIGDQNYGEGSSREHAAMEPRYRGAKVVMCRSFARIAETNLKKQGVLPLWFADSQTYDLIEATDKISVTGLADLTPDANLTCKLHKADGTVTEFIATHTMNAEHIEWFKAGGALNLIRAAQKG